MNFMFGTIKKNSHFIKNEKEYVQIRKYQTFSSIPKEFKDDKIYKFYVELEEQIFSLFSSEITTDQQEEIIKIILSLFESMKEQKNLSQYYVELLVYYLLIRPKQTEMACDLLLCFLSRSSKKKFIYY